MVHIIREQILSMVFTCAQCGQCCMFLGDYIVIDAKTGPYTFSCSCVSTNTSFHAVVDEDKRKFFDIDEFPRAHPHACPFLRPTDDGRIVCTIHETSPAQCKIYRCVAVRIFDEEKQVGYITGMGALHSDDPDLRSLYESCAFEVPKEDLERDEWFARYFEKYGYRTE
ncbi:hypothetical protein [Methanospirillum hungatei]|uniref:hypothetical protein n=1 Tax=Methanospirillum hungatei TaxID=2203 RepID=UPI0026EB1017|nr:hypothetical protein [Methanospirillum hungatei]MCA1916388.1 hypothetical protein [Methanospirillum hungatei]